MTESVSNNFQIDNNNAYPVSEQPEYNKESDYEPSLFEDNTRNEADLIPTDEYSAEETSSDTNGQTASLQADLKAVEDEQGWLGSAWNSFKNFTGIGSSTQKCEQAIQDFKDGKISYEEAKNEISDFSLNQQESVNLASNVISGVAAVGAATLASATIAATGGLAAPVIAAGLGAGAITKAGLKFSDRATNNIDGDALNEKQILKDAASGAVEGVVSAGTMGIGTIGVAAASTIKNSVIQGVKSGIKAGSTAGGLTGAGDYAVETAFDDNKQFNIDELRTNVLYNAAAGALTGGVLSGIAGRLQHENFIKLDNNSKEMFGIYKQNIGEAREQIENEFSDLLNSGRIEISGRPKSEDSVFKKLARKFDSHSLKTTNIDDCINKIGDAYGTRIQMQSVDAKKSKEIIEQELEGYDISHSDFISYINGDKSGLSQSKIETLDNINGFILDSLKEQQSRDVVRQLTESIAEGRLTITELNNYGDEVTSYFTAKQVMEIANAYESIKKDGITIASKEDVIKSVGQKLDMDGNITKYNTEQLLEDSKSVKKVDTKKAVKESGYTSAQMNTNHTFKDGTTGKGELQIRGSNVNKLADVEHIPYDIRQGKITADNKEYEKIYKIIKGMDDETYDKYNKFLADTYRSMRLQELGIPSVPPNIKEVFSGNELSDEALNMLSVDGLVQVSKDAKLYKKMHGQK